LEKEKDIEETGERGGCAGTRKWALFIDFLWRKKVTGMTTEGEYKETQEVSTRPLKNSRERKNS